MENKLITKLQRFYPNYYRYAFKVLTLLFLFLFPLSFIYPEPKCEIDPKKEKLYRLDLSVPATFCKKGNKDPSCKSFPKKSILQLHGLWPNYIQGYPEGKCEANECLTQRSDLGKFCKYPVPKGLYSSKAWKELNSYMAGTEKCLERHEWIKHGLCSPMDPVSYFQWSLEKTKEISSAFEAIADQSIDRKEINALIKKNLPELYGSIRFSCKGKFVSTVYVLFEWGNPPGKPILTKGGDTGFGNCPNTVIFPSL